MSTTEIMTEAWVLHAGTRRKAAHLEPGALHLESFAFPAPTEHEVLAEPLYGTWEGNMTHALTRDPVDICLQRGEKKIVLGNGGVVRILQVGSAVTTVQEGDLCVIFGVDDFDAQGYGQLAVAYDAPGSMGLLAKQIKLPAQQVIPLPQPLTYSVRQWAVFSTRYVSAWSNWQVAYQCWQAQMRGVDPAQTYVVAWGGGVALAECTLAQKHGCQAIMIASSDQRLALGRALGLTMLDRRQFTDLAYDETRFQSDGNYRKAYRKAEGAFYDAIMDLTRGQGASIFIDNIGAPVYPATLRALGRQGVIATCGWKHGMNVTHRRAVECIQRHIHVHTHLAHCSEGVAAVQYAQQHDWMSPEPDTIYAWEAVPQLAADYAAGRIDSYFPLYTVNPV
ncbi:MAG: zinc-binding dehydrogenase [Caldilineaceae bacterium]